MASDYIFIRKSRNALSSFLHVILNILLGVGAIFVTVVSGSWIIGFILVLLSKWRMFAVRSHYLWLNVKSNLVDLIVGFSLVLLAYFSDNAWNTMLSITGVMVLPAYFMSCAYLWKLCEDGEYSSTIISRSTALFTSIFGAFYALWLIYAAGLEYLLLAVIILALGIPVYIRARHEQNSEEKVFSKCERCTAILFIIISLCALYAFFRGIITA